MIVFAWAFVLVFFLLMWRATSFGMAGAVSFMFAFKALVFTVRVLPLLSEDPQPTDPEQPGPQAANLDHPPR